MPVDASAHTGSVSGPPATRSSADAALAAGSPPEAGVDPLLSCETLYCASFEDSGMVEPSASQQVIQHEGQLEQDCGHAHEGECSLSASVVQSSGTAYLALELTNRPAFFLRAYLWVPSDWELRDVAVIHLGAGGDTAGINIDLRQDERFELYIAEQDQAFLSQPGTLRRNEWMCLQLAVSVDDVVGSAELSINDTVIVNATSVDTHPPQGVQLMTLGIDWSASDQAPGTLWFDDVVLDEQFVACL